MPRLSGLARAMQERPEEGDGAQLRIDLDEALSLLDSEAAESIVAAAEAQGIVDEDGAYPRWLSVQSGQDFCLPTEVEWEAAARGRSGRRFAYGDRFDRLRGNTAELPFRRPTPVGVFPDGDTPEGVSDLTGNVLEWTSSAFGCDVEIPEFGYPYDDQDGREARETPADMR